MRRNRRGISQADSAGCDASSHQCCQLRRPKMRCANIALQPDEVKQPKQPCTHLRLLCRVPRRFVVATAPLLILPLALKRDLKSRTCRALRRTCVRRFVSTGVSFAVLRGRRTARITSQWATDCATRGTILALRLQCFARCKCLIEIRGHCADGWHCEKKIRG